jgi:hypothetical protein
MLNSNIAGSEIQEALGRVVGSPEFLRAEQLRAFLNYIVEAELAGRGSSLNEYLIGVEALGKPKGYSPVEDGMVRNRAVALRKRLREYYESEGIDDPVQIEIPKGGYRPVFRRGAVEPLPARPPVSRKIAGARRFRDLGFVVLGAALCWIATVLLFDGRDKAQIDTIVRETLGPLLEPGNSSLIAVATGAHLLLRPENTIIPAGDPGSPVPELASWYKELRHLPPAREVYLRPSITSTMWGDLAAAVTVSKLMAAAGKDSKVLPELATSMPVFRDSSAIIIGRPEYSVIVTSLLSGAPLSIEFSEAINEYGVVEQGAPAAAVPLYTPVFDSNRHSRIAYGLVTVLPSHTASSARSKTIILSGTMSAGTQAAAEFISSPDLLRAFRADLALGGYDSLPEAYQAVVRTEVDRTMALVVEYETYRIIESGRSRRLALGSAQNGGVR